MFKTIILGFILAFSAPAAMAASIEYKLTTDAWTDVGRGGVECSGPSDAIFSETDSIAAPQPSDVGLQLIFKKDASYFEPSTWAAHTWLKLIGNSSSAKITCQPALRPVWHP